MRPTPALAFLLLAATAGAQTNPAFDVAAIKPSRTTAGCQIRFLPGGRFSADCWLKQLIQAAYDVQDYQVAGGPPWLNDWYTINATSADASANQQQMTGMLRSLLEDRFKLVTHREERSIPVYVLLTDKDGPKLKPLKDGETSACRRDNSYICGVRAPADLARSLKSLKRPVLDRTGISGNFDVLLDFDTYTAMGRTPPPDYDKPALSTALREQLGLRLETDNAPISMLVVDKAERPSEN